MDALNQVGRHSRTEKLLPYSHGITGRVAALAVLVTQNTFGYVWIRFWIRLDTFLYCNSLTMMLLLLIAISRHIQTISVSMTIAQY